ncbi:HAMP domain-containing sensor histidine kinase [Eubacterium sp. AM46-8]|jgi:two-component system sensor histidine kinase VanS|uniref:sensor histidine kinase n=1 Tax=Eubacterium sp. AM46-8 TaxID=2292350 RepID=UPI000E52FADC|nr:HAMP domain-containing sensor histidine kinase [Eubacterium sp. AM46-8]RGZ93055.1 sensor histidine kinase [Eubacterium sp. AM46-8]
MKIHSIKFKITLLLVVTVTCLVSMLIGFNSIFSEKVYMNRKQKSMINSYENVNEIMQKYTDSQIDKDTMCADMENISTAKGISVLVVDSSWCTIYVSTQGDDSMMERLRMSIFNGDIFKNNGSPDKAPEPKEQEDDSDNPADKDDKNNHRKRLEDIIDMSGTSLVENRTIISSNDKYTLQKVYDERLGDYYLEIWGTLDNGYSIILRTPIQGIKDNVNISTTLIKYVGGAILIVGIISAFVVSTYITRPIKQLSDIAERMSEMDFDARYEGSDKGEIGLLGKSMNNMSEKLEHNIAELKKANLELKRDIDKKEKLEIMRTDFLSNVSHELKTPIALIQGYAEGLKEGITDDPESMGFYCDVIMDEANKMNTMVKRLLTLNQIEFGNDEPDMERFNINELIASVVDANAIRAGQKNMSIVFDNRNEQNFVWADEYKTEEVLTNYISNALNHCDGKQAIEVRTSKSEDGATITVTVYNSGRNIAEEDLERIWEKFYKTDKARTREYGGNGIGLSIVKAIMESMGQEYGVRNVSDGVEFWFTLDCKS